MPLEVATFINQLVATNPVGALDQKAQGDDHLRLIKSTLQATFPNIAGAVTVTHTQINTVVGSGITGFASPSATIGLVAVNGAALTAMRSDGAPALSQAITPTWTGAHIFNGNVTANAGLNGNWTAAGNPTLSGAPTFSGEPTFSKTRSGANNWAFRLSSILPGFMLNETAAIANSRRWYMVAAGAELSFGALDDAEGASSRAVEFKRSAHNVTIVNVPTAQLQYNGTEVGFRGSMVDYNGSAAIADADRGRVIRFIGAAGSNITFPSMPAGSMVGIVNNSGGSCNLIAGGGMVLYHADGVSYTAGSRVLSVSGAVVALWLTTTAVALYGLAGVS